MPKTSDEKKRDEALTRALNMPPMPHKPVENKNDKGKKKDGHAAGKAKRGRSGSKKP